ncbi:MAG: hypothetical protein ACJAX4_002316 [Clostridium sp.]|jgi:hypothetical protein
MIFTKWSDFKKTLKINNYIKNPTTPTYLYVISQNIMASSERTMIATLQGLISNQSINQIYTLNDAHPDYQIWLDDLVSSYGIAYEIISDPFRLLDIFKDYIEGYVLYNNSSIKDPSINNACSLAALNNCIAVDEDIQDKVRLYGITKIKGDCRNTDEKWAYDHLWNSGLNHTILIQLSPTNFSALRDYGIMTKSLMFYEDKINDTSLRDKIFSSMEQNSICLGWGPDEFINISTVSKYGISMIAADWSYNLTVLSAFPSLPITQRAIMNTESKENVHNVTFIISDGDNQQWNLGTQYSSTKWYGSPYKGKFNFGWSLSPSLYYLAPTVFKLYYESAAYGLTNDYFIVPPSGTGYMFPSKFPRNALDIYINSLNDYMKKTDQKYVSIIDYYSFPNIELWDRFTNKDNIKGLFYLDYDKHDNYNGEIIWSNNKPIVACRDLLWDNLENEDELVEIINKRTSSGQVNICNSNSYTFVYVHAWSKNLSNVERVVTKLKENPKVAIVTPETFMELIKKNVEH